MSDSTLIRWCPVCRVAGEQDVAVRQGPGVLFDFPAWLVNMGFKCRVCGHEWGFETQEEVKVINER